MSRYSEGSGVIFAEKTILYVEDNPVLANFTSDCLYTIGFGAVVVASNLCQADAVASGRKIDVALLDVHLGPVNTLDLARSLSAAGTRIVFTSGYTREEFGEKLGDFAFVAKPYTLEKLSVAIAETLAKPPGNLVAE